MQTRRFAITYRRTGSRVNGVRFGGAARRHAVSLSVRGAAATPDFRGVWEVEHSPLRPVRQIGATHSRSRKPTVIRANLRPTPPSPEVC